MKNEEQIEKLAYVLGEIGFNGKGIADFLREHFGKEKLVWTQEDSFGKDRVTSELRLSMDNSSRFYMRRAWPLPYIIPQGVKAMNFP